MRLLRFVAVPLSLFALIALFVQSGCGKCSPGNPASYKSCTPDDGYAHSAQCQPGQYCSPLIPGSVSDSHCVNSCKTSGCGPTEYCQPIGLGSLCGHIIDQDAGTAEDGGACMTFLTCQPNNCQ